MHGSIRYLLLQVRNPDDPMAGHEVRCFASALRCDTDRIRTMDLINHCPTPKELDTVDCVLLGGSGDYSVVEGGPWLPRALEAMQELHAFAKPTFASCWGFQAMARALGGKVVTDLNRAEVGTFDLNLSPAGAADPVFGPLGSPFLAQIGHQDIVDELPTGATLLASSERVVNHAFHFEGMPIYCTQFHPELTKTTLLDRLQRYPSYVQKITGMQYDDFIKTLRETDGASGLLERFVTHVFG